MGLTLEGSRECTVVVVTKKYIILLKSVGTYLVEPPPTHTHNPGVSTHKALVQTPCEVTPFEVSCLTNPDQLSSMVPVTLLVVTRVQTLFSAITLRSDRLFESHRALVFSPALLVKLVIHIP